MVIVVNGGLHALVSRGQEGSSGLLLGLVGGVGTARRELAGPESQQEALPAKVLL